MPRGRKPKTTQAITATPATVVLSAPIVVDRSRLTLGDMLTFSKLSTLGQADAAAQNAAMIEILPVLDRLVVGGILGRPATELTAIMEAVGQQLNETANPKI